jgi:hypothetical protein
LVLGRFASGLKQPPYWQETHTLAEARSRGAGWVPYNEGGAQSDPIQKRLGTYVGYLALGACTPLLHRWNVRIKGFPALSRRPQTTRCSPQCRPAPRRGRAVRKTAKVTRPKRGAGAEAMGSSGAPWRAAYHQAANSILYLLVFANIAGAQPLGDVWSQKHKSCVLRVHAAVIPHHLYVVYTVIRLLSLL